MRKRVYLSGPISNGGAYPGYTVQQANMVEAAKIAQELMDMGYAVFCPQLTVHMEELNNQYNSHEVWMENDLPWVRCADLVVRIPGESKGADMECDYAHAHKIPVVQWDDEVRNIIIVDPPAKEKPTPQTPKDWREPGKSVSVGQTGWIHDDVISEVGLPHTKADEAKELVYGPREESYGHPHSDFSRTAKMWSAILGVEIRAWQVALMMVALKISREVNRPGSNGDNITDGIGYFLTLDRVYERERPEN